MRASMQRFNLSNDLATYIHTRSAVIINRLFISAYAILDWSAYSDISGILNKKFFFYILSNITYKSLCMHLNIIYIYMYIICIIIIFQKVSKSDLGEVVILDADNNTIKSPFQDLESLPQDVVRKAIYCYDTI